MEMPKWSSNIKGLLLDITGVLITGDEAIPGSVAAVAKLQEAGIPFRLVTNETLKTRITIKESLGKLGYNIPLELIFSPLPAVLEILKNEKLRPHLLLHQRVLSEFAGIDMTNPNCVVVGDASDNFTYDNLNDCFRILMKMENPVLFSLGMGKYYLDEDGLNLDVGAYCKGLEFSTGVKARVVGKPSKEYFMTAVNDLGLPTEEVVMIGDDIASDVGGAQSCGLRGILVRTGKYLPCDETHPTVKPDAIVNNLEEAVDTILKNRASP